MSTAAKRALFVGGVYLGSAHAAGLILGMVTDEWGLLLVITLLFDLPLLLLALLTWVASRLFPGEDQCQQKTPTGRPRSG